MRSVAVSLGRNKPGNALLSFLAVEFICVAAFLMLAGQGRMEWAASMLFGPLQLLAWALLLGDSFSVLVCFSALLPLATAEFLPHAYVQFAYYPGTVLIIAVLLLTRFVYAGGVPPSRLSRWEQVPLVALAVVVVASCANATLRGWGNKHLIMSTLLAIELLATTYFFAVVPRTVRHVRVLLYVLIAMSVLAVAVVASLPPPVGEGGALGGKVARTPFGVLNLNSFGCVTAVVAAAIVGLLVDEQRALGRLLLGFALVSVLVMLVMTKSRGAWVGFGLAFLYLLLRSRSLWLFVIAAGACAIVLSSEVLFRVVSVRAGETSVHDNSLWGRLLLWRYAWTVGLDNWMLGVGMDNYREVKHVYGFPQPRSYALRYNAHNLYLELFADLGIPGVLGFVWLLIRSLLHSLRLAGPGHPRARGPALALGAGLIAYAVHGLVDAFTYQHGTFVLLGVLIGLSLCLNRLNGTSDVGGPAANAGNLVPAGGT